MKWEEGLQSGGKRHMSVFADMAPRQQTLADQPYLAVELHTERNGNLLPESIALKQVIPVWWQCPKGHEYKMTPWLRAFGGLGCPICANKHQHVALATQTQERGTRKT
jgi:hypothetical protein